MAFLTIVHNHFHEPTLVGKLNRILANQEIILANIQDLRDNGAAALAALAEIRIDIANLQTPGGFTPAEADEAAGILLGVKTEAQAVAALVP